MAKLKPGGLGLGALLTALVAFGPLSTDLYLPALPQIGTSLGASDTQVQWTLSAFVIAFAVSQLAYGPLSDRYGRRPVVLAGMAIFVLASIACALAPSIELLVAARFVQAIGACSGPVLARAIVRDLYGADRAATMLAYMAMAMTVAPVLGPIIGGYLTIWFDWPANFWLLTLFGALILAAVLWGLAESNRFRDPMATQPRALLRNYLHLLGRRDYIGCVGVSAGAYSGIFSFISGSSFLFIDSLGMTPDQYGFVFGAVVAGYMIGSLAAARFSARAGPSRMMAVGVTISAVAGVLTLAALLILGPRADTVLAGFSLFMLGAGLTLPNTIAAAIGPFPMMAGLASALMGFCQMSVAAIIGIGITVLADGSGISMGAALAMVSLLSAASYWLLARRPAPG